MRYDLDLSWDSRLSRELQRIDHPNPIQAIGDVLIYFATGRDTHRQKENAMAKAKQRYSLEVWHMVHDHAVEAGAELPEAVDRADDAVLKLLSVSSGFIKTGVR